MRWELEARGEGTRLTLWTNIGHRFIAMGAAGWQRLHAEYIKQFGIETLNWPDGTFPSLVCRTPLRKSPRVGFTNAHASKNKTAKRGAAGLVVVHAGANLGQPPIRARLTTAGHSSTRHSAHEPV
jgi:hypothetical protein